MHRPPGLFHGEWGALPPGWPCNLYGDINRTYPNIERLRQKLIALTKSAEAWERRKDAPSNMDIRLEPLSHANLRQWYSPGMTGVERHHPCLVYPHTGRTARNMQWLWEETLFPTRSLVRSRRPHPHLPWGRGRISGAWIQNHCDICPREAKTLVMFALKLSQKWQQSYYHVCGYLKFQVSVVIVRATLRCISGSSVSWKKTNCRFRLWKDRSGSGLFLR